MNLTYLYAQLYKCIWLYSYYWRRWVKARGKTVRGPILYVCTHISMCVYIYGYIYTYICVYICIYTTGDGGRMPKGKRTRVQFHIFAWMNVCMFVVCVYVCMYVVCIYVCVNIMCDMTHWYVWHDSFIWVTWLIHMYVVCIYVCVYVLCIYVCVYMVHMYVCTCMLYAYMYLYTCIFRTRGDDEQQSTGKQTRVYGMATISRLLKIIGLFGRI